MEAPPSSSFDDFVNKFQYGSKEYPSRLPSVKHRFVAPEGKSEGERMVHRILNELGYRYMEDYYCEFSPEELGKLRFDFFLSKVKLFIEFDGSQHYEGSRFHRTRGEWLEAIQRDELKNQFCKTRGYSLLRVPHIYVKDYRVFKDLVSEFINRVCFSSEPVIDVDLYFKWKAGKIHHFSR